MGKTKNKFTFKILVSYLILAGLAGLAGFFIFSEIQIYISTDTAGENDTKLLKTSALLTNMHEAESLSKLALQSRTKNNFNAYTSKIDSILTDVDSLKTLSESDYQKNLLDSLQILLRKKVANNNELRSLKVRNNATNSIDSAIKKLDNMEASLGIITPEMLAPNIKELPIEAQRAIRKLADFYNQNVPQDKNDLNNTKKIDSILNVSRNLLTEAKIKDFRTQRSLELKEMQVNRNDLELSQQLRNIISAFEREIIVNTYNDNVKKQSALRRSIRLAVFAALLGFVITGIFTFLINRDFWKIQTYREKLEKEKKYSESLLKSREQLISTVSHDLRTPLNTIFGYAELIENSGLTEKQKSYLKNVRSASGYVNDLVNDLLDFSKLEAGQLKVESIPFVPFHLIQETASAIKEIHKEKPIALQLEIDEKLQTTHLGDPFRIRQILNNLIGNAYKFTNKGFIKIKAWTEKRDSGIIAAYISIADSGIGIKEEKQEHIFQEFAQADDDTEKKYGGYGLGLTISKKLTELLDGSLHMKSEEDKGSTFTVQLPLQPTNAITPTTPDTLLKSGASLSILVIDDDTAMLQLLQEVCANSNIKAMVYSDFNDIKKEMNTPYDAVITDIQMPNINGFKVLEKLKSGLYTHYTHQPIIAMTGRRDLDMNVYTKAGFDKTIQKPFSKTTFFTVLGEFFPDSFLPKKEQNEDEIIKNESNLFNLSLISSFLDKNEDALNEILETFLIETQSNMVQLKTAIEHEDLNKINDISHKMLPMFRQLKAEDCIPILEAFEQLESIFENDLKSKFYSLKNKVTALELALRHYISTSPSYSD
ncbi:ATP-binding response regulator [Costertonia aggregata]|uniref:histidine kinase n=1 Tax=Costertonia aggregata TaxID=343403 RepID=A0A7H9AQ89_9FLAO|nr:ATP-binding protein [Costertonia aggregata]QLG45641.1 response regulator [Costertonia aggregata]